MISFPNIDTILPQVNGNGVYSFPSTATQLVKLDLVYEAGSVYQPKPLCANAANRLSLVAGGEYRAEHFAEFLDYRGIIVERTPHVYQPGYTVYFLRKYADELIPAMSDVLANPIFGDREFQAWGAKRYQQLVTALRKTREVARKSFYQALFPQGHSLSAYAEPEDVSRLQVCDVADFYADHYLAGPCGIVLSGDVDDILLKQIGERFKVKASTTHIEQSFVPLKPSTHHVDVPGAVQNSLYIGRILPIRWNEATYAQFLILTTALGGYFGSRLMSNVREDKGYTYGIYARTQVYRGCIVFYITADVPNAVSDAACEEVFNEIRRLAEEPLSADELEMVKTVMVGDFLRSVDGVFERSTRFCDMMGADMDEHFTDNLQQAIKNTTAEDLLEVARRLMREEDMTVCTAGGEK